MADFLRFKGAKSVTKQQGDEMRLRRPPQGGDTWQTKRWWGGKGKVVYIKAAIFAVSTSGDDVQLVIPTDNETTAVSIRHDGDGNFTFSDYRGIDRIAVYNADRSELIAEYQFPAISGGSVLKRTIAALAVPPIAPPPEPEPEPEPEPPAEETYDELVARADLIVDVTVQDVDGSNKFFIDGVQQDGIFMQLGSVVVFDQSDASNSTHPLRLYTDAGKTTEVTVGVTLKPGGGGLAFEPVIEGFFSYQCANHAAMGGPLTVSAE